jgi:Protein of unknown function (DUF1679)
MTDIDSNDTLMPIWIDDCTIDSQWIGSKTGIQNINTISGQDDSNKMRQSTNNCIKDGATILLTINVDKNENPSDQRSRLIQLVIKQTSRTNKNQLQLSRTLGLTREALFYSNLIGPHMHPLLTNDLPKIYYSYSNPSTGEKCIIMEYLDPNCWIDSGILYGPGNPNNWTRNINEMLKHAYPTYNSISNTCSNENDSTCHQGPPPIRIVAETTFRAIARIHGHYWCKKDSLLHPSMTSLRGYDWIQGNGCKSWEASQNMIQSIWNKYCTNSQNFVQQIQWNSHVKEIVNASVSRISWSSQLERLNTTNKNIHWTLVHGDFWPGNVLWNTKADTSNGQIKLLDWEMVGIGSGPQDLGQYMISNCTASERRECEVMLIQAYYEELVQSIQNQNTSVELASDQGISLEKQQQQQQQQKCNISVPSFDYCWHEYTYGGIERWIWFLIWFLGQNDVSLQGWTQYFHNQISDFVLDHEISLDKIQQPRP